MADYIVAFDEIENLNHAADVGFRGTNLKVFYRQVDVVVNNLAETFNGFIINARTKHLIYMFEDIKTALMQRFVMKR